MHKVGVLGGGAFGTALAKLFAERDCATQIWSRDKKICAGINEHHHTPKLKGIELPANLKADSDLEHVVTHAELLVSALPVSALRTTWTAALPFLQEKCLILCASKGIEEDRLCFPNEILQTIMSAHLNHVVYLAGPSFAIEMAQQLPTWVVLASSQSVPLAQIADLLRSDLLHISITDDVMGVEIAAALKNVIAIAAGVCDGLKLGANAKAGLVTLGFAEISRFMLAKGGSLETMHGFAGLGDLLLTCNGNLSRNWRLGMALGQGQDLKTVVDNLGEVAAGIDAAKSVFHLAQSAKIEMPVCENVYHLLFGKMAPSNMVRSIMQHSANTPSVYR